jgi:hypothetical protein
MSGCIDKISYEKIKELVLHSYFDGCRDLGLAERRGHDQIMGFVIYQFENAFEKPAEYLALYVIELIISGGWHEDAELYLRRQIADLLAQQGANNLLSQFMSSDVDVLRGDLHALGFV